MHERRHRLLHHLRLLLRQRRLLHDWLAGGADDAHWPVGARDSAPRLRHDAAHWRDGHHGAGRRAARVVQVRGRLLVRVRVVHVHHLQEG